MLTTVLVLTLAQAASGPLTTGKTKTGIAYDVQGKGPVVVLLTGSNLDRRMWTREAGWLSATHTVIRYDLRAHGASDTATAPYSNVDDLFGLLDELGIQKATLVGLSAGSTIALDATLAQPSRVEKLVLVGPAPSGYRPASMPEFFKPLMTALQAGDYTKAGEVLLESPVFIVAPESEPLVRRMVMENNRLWTVPREFVKPPDRPAMERLSEVKVPTLVLIGDRDTLQRPPAELLAKGINGARLAVVPGGHLLNLTSPNLFRAELERFLR